MSRRMVAPALLIALVLAGCGTNDTVGIATAQASRSAAPSAAENTPEPTEEATPTPEPTPTPTPEAKAPEIAAFNVTKGDYFSTLSVRLHNPNEGIGLIRAGFELTALAADGSIIDVFGSEGMPGAACCTIYRLPPGGDFGLSITLDPNAADVDALELAVTDRWVDWTTIEPPEVEVTNPTVVAQEFGGPSVTGRVAVPDAAENGPFNVWITAFVQSASGLVVVAGSVDCVASADPRAFSIDSFVDGAPGPYTLESLAAYTTTVPGETEPAPGC